MSLLLDGVQEEFPLLEHVWADQGYTGKGKSWIEEHLGWSVEIVQHPPHARGEWRWVPDPDDPTHARFEWLRLPPAKKEFRGILPRRWVGERTFSWLAQSRRLDRDPWRVAAFCECVTGYVLQGPGDGGAQLVDPTGIGPRLKFNRGAEPKTGKNRLHLDIGVEDMDSMAERLQALGGRILASFPDHIVLADPEGNEFCIR